MDDIVVAIWKFRCIVTCGHLSMLEANEFGFSVCLIKDEIHLS